MRQFIVHDACLWNHVSLTSRWFYLNSCGNKDWAFSPACELDNSLLWSFADHAPIAAGAATTLCQKWCNPSTFKSDWKKSIKASSDKEAAMTTASPPGLQQPASLDFDTTSEWPAWILHFDDYCYALGSERVLGRGTSMHFALYHGSTSKGHLRHLQSFCRRFEEI